MPDGILVDYKTIDIAADDCTKTCTELETLFEDLKTKLGPLVDTWEGDAKLGYDEAQLKWDNSFIELKQLLARVAAVLPQLRDGYQETEKGVTALF